MSGAQSEPRASMEPLSEDSPSDADVEMVLGDTRAEPELFGLSYLSCRGTDELLRLRIGASSSSSSTSKNVFFTMTGRPSCCTPSPKSVAAAGLQRMPNGVSQEIAEPHRPKIKSR